MIGRGEENKLTDFSETKKDDAPGEELSLRWTYNYFSVGSKNTGGDWRENLPLVLREIVGNEKQ